MHHDYCRVVGTTVSSVSNRHGPDSPSTDGRDDGIQKQYIVIEEYNEENDESKYLLHNSPGAGLVRVEIEITTVNDVDSADDSVPCSCDP